MRLPESVLTKTKQRLAEKAEALQVEKPVEPKPEVDTSQADTTVVPVATDELIATPEAQEVKSAEEIEREKHGTQRIPTHHPDARSLRERKRMEQESASRPTPEQKANAHVNKMKAHRGSGHSWRINARGTHVECSCGETLYKISQGVTPPDNRNNARVHKSIQPIPTKPPHLQRIADQEVDRG